ncbi:hypothetical protein RHGRI_032156 [Rhododendron griersonianum]|uniref:Uncharacterized protein n=1 Tax=Rhododendron griersonianum TaxID=479676 RepID=A0AAV6IBG0_9ERIC|nr:hypothetical protein RHGRI_032156 [Rhododendron griersonianum]
MVLRKLVDDASKFLNDKVTKAVVTVPKDVGRIAGFEVLRIINEPTAVSLAYGLVLKRTMKTYWHLTLEVIKELGDKIPGPVKEKVEAKLGELKEAISGGSTQAMKDAVVALNQEVMQLGQSLYNQPGATPGGAGPTPGGSTGPSDSTGKGPDGDVIDADFSDSK